MSSSIPDTSTELAKPARKQNVSCDACKFRKVRCDRIRKIENRQANENEDSIACSVCSSHGLRCTYTQVAPKRRRGKRIVAIQRGQLDDLDDTLALRSLEHSDPMSNSIQSPFGTDFVSLNNRYDGEKDNGANVSGINSYAVYSADMTTTSPASSTTPLEGLLDVRGLTRALLDACVKSYFKYAGPCMPILHAEVFAARYALFFASYEKNKGITPFWKTSQEDAHSMDRPLSELLLLAVGCIGAALLEPPIAEFGSSSKFRLQDRLALKFQERLSKDDLLLRLQHEGTDVIEACYVMSDPFLSVLGDDLPSRSAIDWNTIALLDRSQRDPLRLRPASHEGIVRLLYKMGINRRPSLRKNCPPGDNRIWEAQGAFVSEREVFRRVRIFWSAFMQDSFRSMGERRNVLIGYDDYDLDLPKFESRLDGSFTALMFGNSLREKSAKGEVESFLSSSDPNLETRDDGKETNSINLQQAVLSKFDAMQFEVMLRLAFIIRTVSIRFVSPRSQGRGVLVSDVERAINSLSAWYQQLPADVTWECQSEPLQNALLNGRTSSSNALAMRNSLKALFVEMLYHGNVLSVWASVDSFGMRFDVDLTESMSLFARGMKIHDDDPRAAMASNSSHSSSSSAAPPFSSPAYSSHKAPEELRVIAKQRLDDLAARSFLRVAKVSKEAARLGLVRANRLVYVNVFSTYAVWGCGLARKLAASSKDASGGGVVGGNAKDGRRSFLVDVPPGYNQIDYVFKCVEDILYALGAIDSFEGVAERVSQFKELLQKSRESCRDGNQSGKNESKQTSAQTSANASPSNVVLAAGNEEEGGGGGVDDSSQVDAPFRYYFRTRGQRGFGDTTEGLGRASRGEEGKSGGHQNMDEVDMLAYAAVPFKVGLGVRNGTPSSDVKSGDTPESSKGATNDPDLVLDLESIAGMDTNWLHQYLQNNEGQLQQSLPSSSLQQATTSQSTDSYYINSSDAAAPSLNAYSAGNPFAFHGTTTNTYPGNNNLAASSVNTATDSQWIQFMTNSDAQIWADAQWQGFNTDTQMA